MKTKVKIIRVPFDGETPKTVPVDTQVIVNSIGRYNRGLETKDFIYFINYQEGDENGCVMMYRRKGMKLASDNHFAHSSMTETIEEKEKDITFISRTMKTNIRLYKESQED